MTDTDIVTRLAEEAGLEKHETDRLGRRMYWVTVDDLGQFAALVAEECAKVAEQTYEGSHGTYSDEDGIISGYDYFGENSAAAIRAKFKA